MLEIRRLGDFNALYNFQDTNILCKIFESRATFLNDKYNFNPRKCNSASTFSGCTHRDKNNVVITLPTHVETVKLFEKTSIGGFTCINTRLAFDKNILFPNEENEKRKDLKLIYKLKLDDKFENKRVVSKILKMDKNNQYGNAMTKPLSFGCIKKQKEVPDLRKFNTILENLSDEDMIGHLFIVYIKFNEKLVNEKICFLMKSIHLVLRRKS